MGNGQHRWFVVVMSVAPLAATLVAGWLTATGQVTAVDLGLFAGMYVIAVVGVTVGFHRLLAHRSFEAVPWVRAALTVAGSIAAQGPSIVWVAHHRRHHRMADRPGDPHSPYLGADGTVLSGWRGWWHAHLGWLLDSSLISDHVRYCPDLVREKTQRWMSIHFLGLVAVGVIGPGVIAGLLSQSVVGALTGVLWGGLVRIFVVNQITYTINSLGHLVGRRPTATHDQSHNLGFLALASFGESWHNNHHASPRSPRFAQRWWQLDLGHVVIVILKRLRLAGNRAATTVGTLGARDEGSGLLIAARAGPEGQPVR